MQYNTGIGLALSGICLILLTSSRGRRAQWLAVPVGLLGSLTLIEYTLGRNLGLDCLFFTPYFEVASAFPGRMSPLTASCFVFIALATAFLGARPRFHRMIVGGFLGVCVSTIAFVALLGFCFGISAAYGWGAYSQIAVNTSTVFLLLGVGFVVQAFRIAQEDNWGLLAWLPVMASVTLIVMIAFISAMNRTDLARTTFWRRHTIEVILRTHAYEENLIAILSGAQDYAVSGSPDARALFEAAVRREPHLLEALVTMTDDNPAQQAILGQLAADMREFVGFEISVVGAGPGNAGRSRLPVSARRENSALAQQVRKDLASFSLEEERLLAVREESEQRDSGNSARMLVVVRVSAALLLIVANIMTGIEVARRRKAERERENLIVQLRQALLEVNTLSGMVPICGWCKSVRTDKGYWETVEEYIASRSEATFTHGICPDCAAKVHAEIKELKV